MIYLEIHFVGSFLVCAGGEGGLGVWVSGSFSEARSFEGQG